MKIHNYGNDYVQARKFKVTENAGNRIEKDEQTTPKQVCAEANLPKEGAKPKKTSKKKESDKEDNI